MADSAVIEAMRAWKLALRQREAAQMEAMARRWLDLEQALDAQIELLVRTLAAQAESGNPVTQGQLLRLARYQTLLAQINEQWAAYQEYATDLITSEQLVYGQAGVQHGVESVSMVARGALVAADLNRLPIEAVENAVGLLADGSPLNVWLMRNVVRAEAVDRMTGALLQGVALGWNPRRTARAMKDGLAGGLNQALNTARTEQMRVYREMNRQQMAASGVVDGYYRLATRDNRTCPACLARDGEFIPLGQEMAEHNQGRCAQVPNVVGYEAPQWLKGPEWFAQQPEAAQRAQLGKARFEAWQRGDFDFGDLAQVERNATWGNQLRVTPVNQLVNG